LQALGNAKLVRNFVVAAVFFLMSLPLDFGAIWQAMRRPWAALLAVAVNFGILPLVAWGGSQLLQGDLAIGLLIAGAGPSTLASAAVWTRRAGGNDAVAMLVTLITNISCVVITPLWLVATTGSHVTIELAPMIVKLALLVVLPMSLAQLLRLYYPLSLWVMQQRAAIAVGSQLGVLSMVLVGTIKAGGKLAEISPGEAYHAWQYVAMIVAVLSVHLTMLATGHLLAWLLGIPRADRIAVGFSGSQKTLVVGLSIAIDEFGGLALLPMVAYHVCQLLVDTVIADRLRHAGEKEKKVKGKSKN